MYSNQYSEQPEETWKLLFKDALGEPKTLGVVFLRRADAINWALHNHIRDFVVVPTSEYYAFLESHDEMVNNELSWWRGRIPRPCYREIQVIDEEPEFRDVTPRTNFVSIVPRKVSLFKPVFVGTRRQQAIEETEEVDDIYVEKRELSGVKKKEVDRWLSPQ